MAVPATNACIVDMGFCCPLDSASAFGYSISRQTATSKWPESDLRTRAESAWQALAYRKYLAQIKVSDKCSLPHACHMH